MARGANFDLGPVIADERQIHTILGAAQLSGLADLSAEIRLSAGTYYICNDVPRHPGTSTAAACKKFRWPGWP